MCVGMCVWVFVFFFFFQAEDGIRDDQESRGLGDVYKRTVNSPSEDHFTEVPYQLSSINTMSMLLFCLDLFCFCLESMKAMSA